MLKNLKAIIVNDDEYNLPAGFTISAINTQKVYNHKLIEQIGRLRYNVWQNQGMTMPTDNQQQRLIDTIDQNAIIWVVYKHNELVATARLNIYDDLTQSPTAYMHQTFTEQYPLPAATFTRLVVSKACRGLKIGRLLDKLRLEQARLMGVKSVLLMCPPPRAEALQKFGYENLGKAEPSKLWPDAEWILMRYLLNVKKTVG